MTPSSHLGRRFTQRRSPHVRDFRLVRQRLARSWGRPTRFGVLTDAAVTPTTTPTHDQNDTVLVVDFGAQYAQLIARRVRELNVYSEIAPHKITAAEIAQRQPAAIILSGGPKSVHV